MPLGLWLVADVWIERSGSAWCKWRLSSLQGQSGRTCFFWNAGSKHFKRLIPLKLWGQLHYIGGVCNVVYFKCVQEIANVHCHYERMKNSLLPPSAGVTLQNLAGAVQKCTLEYKQWQEQIAVSPNAWHCLNSY